MSRPPRACLGSLLALGAVLACSSSEEGGRAADVAGDPSETGVSADLEAPSDAVADGPEDPGPELGEPAEDAPDGVTDPPRILVFSRTRGFRHGSIDEGVAAVRALGENAGFAVDATEDEQDFRDDNLARYAAVLFLSTTGDVLGPDQQGAMERFIQAGKGYVGVHSASDTEYDWPWYGGLAGAYFADHPQIQEASIVVEDAEHPSTADLPSPWVRTDEWYNFASNPRDSVHVLLRLDESTYEGGSMGDHPIAWCQEYDGGRAFYTALAHTEASFQEPAFLAHLLGGILWAAGIVEGDCSPL